MTTHHTVITRETPEVLTPAIDQSSAPQLSQPEPSTTARLGIYLTPEEFDNAKAAYLADWANGGTADTFARWIATAIETYASRSASQRATAPPRGRADEPTGSTRSFNIPTNTLAKMRTAITADQQAGRWPSDSAWCNEAITFAVDQPEPATAAPCQRLHLAYRTDSHADHDLLTQAGTQECLVQAGLIPSASRHR